VQGHRGFGFCDSFIVAAAPVAGRTRLLTSGLEHGKRIEALTVHNRFA
jgi:predicted nucleic acid-binding protein